MNKLRLSERLCLVASNVKSGGTVADIGCDHGFTSIYLVQQKLAKAVIAMDINKEPLKRAKEHISEYGMEEYISTRLSDGAKKLKKGEADTILISGMGGALIVKILSQSIEVVKDVGELVLSPQSEIYLVRHFLHDNGFKIESEDMVKEQGKFYVVIRAVSGKQHFDDSASYIYGEFLINSKNQIFKEYLIKEQERISAILAKLAKKEKLKRRIAVLKEEYSTIEHIIEKMKSEVEQWSK